MLFYLTSQVTSSLAAFIYPCYASYKTLSRRPASEEELERWLMYWSVLGCVVGVEYVAEWLVSWFPFYYTFKTLFLLYIALPQTQGSSYIYIYLLQPFFRSHESQIDATLASVKVKAYAFLQERIRAIWEHIVAAMGQQQQQQQAYLNTPSGNTTPSAQSSPGIAGPMQLAFTLWNSYGPSIMASGAAFLRKSSAAATARPGGNEALRTTPLQAHVRYSSSQSVLERRRQLEAELAALDMQGAAGSSPAPVPMPTASPLLESRGSSDSDLHHRDRSVSGRYEEIHVPSDVEGYDVGQEEDGSGAGRPGGQKRGSWFGWGTSPSSKGDYERVKSE